MKNTLLVFSLLILSHSNIFGQYCSASGNISSYEWIERVSFAFDKKQTGNNGGYHNAVTESPIHVSRGECFYLNMEPGYSGYAYNEFWGVWIDFNQDGDFDDIGENVFLSNYPTNYGAEAQITIPNNTPVGFTRMRVIMQYGSAPSPCGSFTYGEVEDYSFYTEDGLYTCLSTTGSTVFEWIDAVGVADLNLYSGNNDGSNVDYCQLYPHNLGDPFSISVTPGYSGTNYDEYLRISFDKNNDNDFSDVNESLLFLDFNEFETYTFMLGTAIEPNVCHRLRVQLSYYNHALCEYLTYGEVEEYSVYVTDTNNLYDFADQITSSTRQKHNNGDPRQADKLGLKLYPNPAGSITTIDFESQNVEQSAQVFLLDIHGEVIMKKTKDKNESSLQLDLSNITNGTYVVRIQYVNRTEFAKLMVASR